MLCSNFPAAATIPQIFSLEALGAAVAGVISHAVARPPTNLRRSLAARDRTGPEREASMGVKIMVHEPEEGGF